MNLSPVKTVWMFSREYGDLAGAGGVKDVVRQLAEALATDPELQVRVVLPLYGFIDPEEHGMVPLLDPLDVSLRLEFSVSMNYGLEERREVCRIWQGKSGSVTLYLVDAERFREKSNIYTYTDKDSAAESWMKSGTGHYDYFAMNVLLQKSGLELMVMLGERPDVIHCHDGHTALVPAFIHECQGWQSFFRDSGCLVTIHNAGVGYHQEVADLPFAHGITGLSWGCIGENRLAGKFDPFLAAGQYAILNTVSENYARELQETDEDLRTDWLGQSLLERGIVLEGITNGICPDDFNTANGKKLGIADSYDVSAAGASLPGKRNCKASLLNELKRAVEFGSATQHGFLAKDTNHPLFSFIGRLSEQKGVDHFLEAIEQLFLEHEHGQALILGSGSDYLEATILSLIAKKQMRGRLCFLRGYNPELANRVFAASDYFVIPSRYEPCGLTDYIAQLFGAVPIVHHVGGLVKVVDGKTGIAYSGGSAENLYAALEQGLKLYEDKDQLNEIQKEAVKVIREKYTWDVVKKQYLKLYVRAKKRRGQERRHNPDLVRPMG